MAGSKTEEHAAVEKPATKPGRKPLNTEPKNKRTAQNRAAQRAFRERKEKRMKELEDKVLALEQEKLQINNESELLRIQVASLLKQLEKSGVQNEAPQLANTGLNQVNSLPVRSTDHPESVNLEQTDGDNDEVSSNDKSMNGISSNSSVTSYTPGSYGTDDVYKLTPKGFTFNTNISPESESSSHSSSNLHLNLDLRNKLNNQSFKDSYDEQVFCNELSQACGTKSCPIPKSKLGSGGGNETFNLQFDTHKSSIPSLSSPSIMSNEQSSESKSPFSKSILSGNFGSDTNYLSDINKEFGILDSGSDIPNANTNNSNTNRNNANTRLDAAEVFGKQEMGQRGAGSSSWAFDNSLAQFNLLDDQFNISTNDNMINNSNSIMNNIKTSKNEMDFLFNTDDSNNDTKKLIESHPEAFQLDPSSSLFNSDTVDGNFGVDFDNEDLFENILGVSKPNGAKSNDGNYNFDNLDVNTTGAGNNDEEDNEEVPDNTQNLMKCSQIWERITTHPKFTDLDIDNLCDELKQKAKCSEAGVVVNGNDVGKLLHHAICDQQKEKQKDRELDIKKVAISSGSNDFLQGVW